MGLVLSLNNFIRLVEVNGKHLITTTTIGLFSVNSQFDETEVHYIAAKTHCVKYLWFRLQKGV